jgi:hypothetical protein
MIDCPRRLSVVLSAALLAGTVWAGEDPVRAYLPADTRVVFAVNVRSLRDSGLVKKHGPALTDGSFAGLKTRAVTGVKQVVTAYPGVGVTDRATVIVRARTDPAALEAEMKALMARNKRVRMHETTAGRYYEIPEMSQPIPGVKTARSRYVAVLDAETLIVSFGDDGPVKEALEIKAGRRKPADNKALEALLDRLDARDTFSLAMRGAFQGALPPGVVPEGLATAWQLFAQAFKGGVEGQYEHILGGVRVEDDLKVRIMATAKNAEAARELGQNARDSLRQLRQVFAVLALTTRDLQPIHNFLQDVRIVEKEADVTVSGTLSAEQAGQLVRLAVPKKAK